MDWTQYDWEHQYLATPREYPISDNNRPATYDQFIQLRDTLIFTGKYYNDKAGRKLCIWSKLDWTTTNTIEVELTNKFKQSFQPDWKENAESITTGILGEYVSNPDSSIPDELKSQAWGLCCMINRDWHYQLIHKEQILLEPTTNKVCCYIDIYRQNEQWVWELPYKWWVAVFDWEWWREDDNTHFKKTFTGTGTFSWTTSWTDPNGSCSWTCTVNTVITLTLWDLIQKMTAFGYMERDLKKWDFLVLRMKDKGADESTWEPQWNDLKLQRDSNYWSIKWIDPSENI